MIIVSGPDNSGKTTLVKRLCEDLGLNNMPKCTSLPLWANPDDYFDWVMSTLARGQANDIVDRCYIDELVYGPVMRGKVSFSPMQIDLANKLFEACQPLLIVTDPGLVAISKSYAERDQYPELRENLAVREEYYSVLKNRPFSEVPKYIFDYRFDPDYQLVKSFVKDFIRR